MPKKDLPCTYVSGSRQETRCRNIKNIIKLSDDEES